MAYTECLCGTRFDTDDEHDAIAQLESHIISRAECGEYSHALKWMNPPRSTDPPECETCGEKVIRATGYREGRISLTIKPEKKVVFVSDICGGQYGDEIRLVDTYLVHQCQEHENG